MDKFYKLARPDGWDFYTGNTINYRDNIGKEVKCPKFNKDGQLCSSAFIHASRKPDQCFVGAKIPCSAFLVRGNTIKEDTDKCGFKELYVIKELIPKDLFKWDYETACNPIHPFNLIPPTKISNIEKNLLEKWASVWDSMWASVRDSIGDSVWDGMWASVRDSIGASVGVSVWARARDSIGASVGVSVRARARDSIGASVGVSVRASVIAYVGKIFSSCVQKWEYIDHKKNQYPYQAAVDLWMMGLVSSFDGEVWRLHGGEKAEILWEWRK